MSQVKIQSKIFTKEKKITWCAEEIYAAELYQELMNERLLSNWWIQKDAGDNAEAEKIIVQGNKWQMNSRESKFNSDQRRQIAVRKGFIEGGR